MKKYKNPIQKNPESINLINEKLFNLTNKKVVVIGERENYYGILYGPKIPTFTSTVFLVVKNINDAQYQLRWDWDNAFILNSKNIDRIDGRRIYLKSGLKRNPKTKRNPGNSRPLFRVQEKILAIQNKKLFELINTDVLMLIFDRSGTNPGKKFFGTVKLTNSSKWLFQFNPLNQPLSEKNRKKLLQEQTGDNHTEEHMIMELEMEFENNQPTFEFEFDLKNVEQIAGNKILLSFFTPEIREI